MLKFITSGSVESAQDDFTTKTSILGTNATDISFIQPLVINSRSYEMPTITVPSNTGAAVISINYAGSHINCF